MKTLEQQPEAQAQEVRAGTRRAFLSGRMAQPCSDRGLHSLRFGSAKPYSHPGVTLGLSCSKRQVGLETSTHLCSALSWGPRQISVPAAPTKPHPVCRTRIPARSCAAGLHRNPIAPPALLWVGEKFVGNRFLSKPTRKVHRVRDTSSC